MIHLFFMLKAERRSLKIEGRTLKANAAPEELRSELVPCRCLVARCLSPCLIAFCLYAFPAALMPFAFPVAALPFTAMLSCCLIGFYFFPLCLFSFIVAALPFTSILSRCLVAWLYLIENQPIFIANLFSINIP